MDYRYFYIVSSLLYFLIWLFLFVRRKDLRKGMLLLSVAFGIAAVLTEEMFSQDWWRPEMFTGTPIGIEDFLFGFSVAGIAAVLYKELYGLRLKNGAETAGAGKGRRFLLAFAVLFLTLFYVLKLGSFYSAILAYAAGIFFIVSHRKDLIRESVVNGILLLILSSAIYYVLFLIYPNYIEKLWYLGDNWYSILILGIPLKEYLFFFLTGAFIGPLYEFIRDKKLSAD